MTAAPQTEDKTGASMEVQLGYILRNRRLHHGLKISEVAKLAQISQGMASKIENGQVSTSLDMLKRLCDALGLTLSQLFTEIDRPSHVAQLVKAGEGLEVVRRGTERGHTYHLLAYQHGEQKTIEPLLVTMDDASEVFPTFSHPGVEFIHILEGQLEYRHGNQVYHLYPGDSLTFASEVPHGPERLHQVPIKMLSIINYEHD
jgi:transcriptional regulator with XRE-family HTH domain